MLQDSDLGDALTGHGDLELHGAVLEAGHRTGDRAGCRGAAVRFRRARLPAPK